MDIQKQIYLNNLASAAKQNGTTPQQELYNYAMANGYNASDIDTFMDAAPGTAQGWIDANITNKPQSAPQLPYNGPPNPVNSPPTPTTSLPYYGPPNPVNSPATPTNLGMGSKLDDTTRNGVIAEAQRRAAANGTTPEAELYKFNQGQGQSNAQLDSLMGFGAGSADSWAKQNAGQYGVAAPSGNSYSGGSSGPTPSNIPPPNTGGNTPDDFGYGARGLPGISKSPSYGSNLGFGDTGYQRNPYLDQASRDIGSQMFDQWSRNIQPSIRSSAMAAGGFGGSRQGVVEANALNDMSRNYGQALTTMYGQDYTNSQNRGIQRQGQAQNYDLGLRNSDLGFSQLDANIYQNNFGNNLAAANFGLGVQNQLNSNNAAGVNAGTNIQNTPLDYQKYYNDAAKGYGNAGGTRNNTTTT